MMISVTTRQRVSLRTTACCYRLCRTFETRILLFSLAIGSCRVRWPPCLCLTPRFKAGMLCGKVGATSSETSVTPLSLGIRVYDGRVFLLKEHIRRMLNSAKAMGFSYVPSPAFIRVSAVEVVLNIRVTLLLSRRPSSAHGSRTTCSPMPTHVSPSVAVKSPPAP